MLAAIVRGDSARAGRHILCGMFVSIVVNMQPIRSGLRRVVAGQYVRRPSHALQRQTRKQQDQHQIADSNQHAGASITNNGSTAMMFRHNPLEADRAITNL